MEILLVDEDVEEGEVIVEGRANMVFSSTYYEGRQGGEEETIIIDIWLNVFLQEGVGIKELQVLVVFGQLVHFCEFYGLVVAATGEEKPIWTTTYRGYWEVM